MLLILPRPGNREASANLRRLVERKNRKYPKLFKIKKIVNQALCAMIAGQQDVVRAGCV